MNSKETLREINARLSLRAPQHESLNILEKVCELLDLLKEDSTPLDLQTALEKIRAEYPSVEDFEHSFPSLCFSLATGVGKTRLMGAFIAYLYRMGISRNFFVLAPNLTIYNKLIADFQPNSPKYVFPGLNYFALSAPIVVTGDNYEYGRGVRHNRLIDDECIINVFNVSKINGDSKNGTPRIKRLSEYIGTSYFDYLSELDDLVVLMDESHHYRASAGLKAIEELHPLLGLELTATPQVEKGNKTIKFKNVVYNYPLASAMKDGFVKEPAVATRENFDAGAYTPEALEKIKLEDGVRLHEDVKVELETYARANNVDRIKPFMLVVASDINHADALQKQIESDDFFEGRYQGKVIQVNSNLSGEEKEENITRLLNVENADEPTEIVIHVNMLKEGWDVTNLYTIVPLRKANSKTLVEQSIGRGLRLPYGKRTGVKAIDRLTIVSHDKFKEIIDYANDPNSIIRYGVIIGKDVPLKGRKTISLTPVIETLIGASSLDVSPGTAATSDTSSSYSYKSAAPLFSDEKDRLIAQKAYEVIGTIDRLKSSASLQEPETQAQIVKKVKESLLVLDEKVEETRLEEVVKKTAQKYSEFLIDVPVFNVTPKEITYTYIQDFDLDVSRINLQPISQEVLIRELHKGDQYCLNGIGAPVVEPRPENYLVSGLLDYIDVNYTHDRMLVYKLAEQAIARLKEYLSPEDVENVARNCQQVLVNLIHAQMIQHWNEAPTDYEVSPCNGFRTLKSEYGIIESTEEPRDFRLSLIPGKLEHITSMVFTGFSRCLYTMQKFDSNSELEFSRILENDADVLKWFKPNRNVFSIYYRLQGEEKLYLPDFVVETNNYKMLCEVKRASELNDAEVQAKTEAARVWTELASKFDAKEWKLLLIPHDKIMPNATLEGLCVKYQQ